MRCPRRPAAISTPFLLDENRLQRFVMVDVAGKEPLTFHAAKMTLMLTLDSASYAQRCQFYRHGLTVVGRCGGAGRAGRPARRHLKRRQFAERDAQRLLLDRPPGGQTVAGHPWSRPRLYRPADDADQEATDGQHQFIIIRCSSRPVGPPVATSTAASSTSCPGMSSPSASKFPSWRPFIN